MKIINKQLNNTKLLLKYSTLKSETTAYSLFQYKGICSSAHDSVLAPDPLWLEHIF